MEMSDDQYGLSKWLGIYSAGAMTCVAGLLVLLSFLNRNRLKLPPGPRGLPVIGHLHLLRKAPHQSLMDLSKKYGPLMSLKLGSVYTVVVSSPDMAREVLKTQDHVFASRPQSILGEVLAWNYQDLIFASHTSRHFRIMRRVCVEELSNSKRHELYKDIRAKEILRTSNILLSEGREGKPTLLDQRLYELGFNTLSRILFNNSFYGQKTAGSGGKKDFHTLGQEFSAVFGAFIPGDFFPLLRKLDIGGWEATAARVRDDFDDFLGTILEDHREKFKSSGGRHLTDFVDVLLSAQENNDGQGLTEVQIKCLLRDLLIGAIQTSPNHVQWTIAELIRNPEIGENVRKELDEVVGRTRLVEEADLDNLPYLRAVVRESFRLHLVGTLLAPRESVAATKVAGYDIPNRTRVIVNAYAIARDPQVWENPLEFNPNRFLNSPIDLLGHHYEFLPFGAGRRICPGLNLGLIMVELTLAQLMHTCQFSLPEGMTAQDVDMEEEFGGALALAHPLKILATPRLSSEVYMKEYNL